MRPAHGDVTTGRADYPDRSTPTMSTTKRTQKTTPAVPAPGARPSVRVDAALSDDLAVIMATGADFAGAVRAAVGTLADIYRTAWAHGTVPEGETPLLIAYQLAPRPTDAPAVTRPYDGMSDRPTVPRVGRRIPGPYPVRQPAP
ncbi:hypothetical protein SEA_CUMBERBATCH_58 [Streptomyces phage Cumberbatch]|uniref:Uncharacterized protein n=1 Tax=Streptomyces phage Cumberbatch TaxID=2736271 RepID=A0A6M9Z408_9CAUD|nr:hypothetical protein QEN65_gp58 [Streptomyces phage Cumberbatch]QKN87700.1 hypothetical protein SEA_CUMBERBATCH_58 [Streptomyces phage Cumberbatch]